jgi:hypothetical protein
MNNINQILQNPKTMILRKFMTQVLGNDVENYDDLLTRIGFSLITESDMSTFATMVNKIIEVGYLKAVDDYKKQLSEMGIEVSMKS